MTAPGMDNNCCPVSRLMLYTPPCGGRQAA
jgi:hypothetical protein